MMPNESKWLIKLRDNKGSAESQVQSVDKQYIAEMYILDRYGRRVSTDGAEVITCHILPGNSKEEALGSLDTKSYEFKAWM
jgi:hypothetical protein